MISHELWRRSARTWRTRAWAAVCIVTATIASSAAPARDDVGFARIWADPAGSRPRLSQAADGYRTLLREGGWPRVPEGPALRAGDRGAGVRALCARLGLPPSERFDPAVEDAVRAFQVRHGLAADGVVGPATRAALNEPLEGRLAQIERAVAQFNRLPPLDAAYVVVNVPAMLLAAVENGAPVLQMRVVVGRPDWPTPPFSSRFTTVTFSPAWIAPWNVAATEIEPLALRDPGYLMRNGFEILDAAGRSLGHNIRNAAESGSYVFRQRPGDRNALGRVRIAAPNPHNLFLHGTPATRLFRRASRAFSHGCVRLERPVELARWLLADQPEWDDEAVAAATARDEPLMAPVTRNVALHVVYMTAWADLSGAVHFRPDIYGWEKAGGQESAPLAPGCPSPLEGVDASG